MDNVDVFAIEFNFDDAKFETSVFRNVKVTDYDEYTDIVSIASIKEPCKLDEVKIKGNKGYLVTGANLTDADGLNKVLDLFKKHCNDVIHAETAKLICLDELVI